MACSLPQVIITITTRRQSGEDVLRIWNDVFEQFALGIPANYGYSWSRMLSITEITRTTEKCFEFLFCCVYSMEVWKMVWKAFVGKPWCFEVRKANQVLHRQLTRCQRVVAWKKSMPDCNTKIFDEPNAFEPWYRWWRDQDLSLTTLWKKTQSMQTSYGWATCCVCDLSAETTRLVSSAYFTMMFPGVTGWWYEAIYHNIWGQA